MVPICCEINFPLAGINRQISGAVAENERGGLFLVHRGQIGGGRKGIGAELFWKHYEGEPSVVIDGDRETELVVVGSLQSPRFLRQIQCFVREIERIKALAHSEDEQHTEEGNQIEIRDIGEEFLTRMRYSFTRTVDPTCDHAIIVNGLRRELRKRGYSIGKDQLRDLYVHRKSHITSLFEVKPDTSTTSIYSAVGQLLLYSVVLPIRPKLIFVAPEELSVETQGNLKKIGIEVLTFRWVSSEPEFPGLADWNF
jgi:hypothetical protein